MYSNTKEKIENFKILLKIINEFNLLKPNLTTRYIFPESSMHQKGQVETCIY